MFDSVFVPDSPFHLSLIRKYERGKYHCTIDLLFDWFGLVCFATVVSCHTADSKPVKQEVNGTGILPPLVLLGLMFEGKPRLLTYSGAPGRCFTQVGSCLTLKL